MIPRSFEYFSPRTLDEAIALQRLGPDAKSRRPESHTDDETETPVARVHRRY